MPRGLKNPVQYYPFGNIAIEGQYFSRNHTENSTKAITDMCVCGAADQFCGV